MCLRETGLSLALFILNRRAGIYGNWQIYKREDEEEEKEEIEEKVEKEEKE